MIISASRRTDIPAFYANWFINRVKDGYVLVRNPFNTRQLRRVSLRTQDVDAVVFWTRNGEPLIEHLPFLNSEGYRYYFQYTITGYPRTLEKSVPHPVRAIETFSKISDEIGPRRVVWRYDPVLISNFVGIDDHKRIFLKIASMLRGRTHRVVVSFADFYRKTEKNLRLVQNLDYRDIVSDESALLDLSIYMRQVANDHGMSIQSCAEKVDLSMAGIAHGKCIDDQLLESEFGLQLNLEKDRGQREECGCVKSVDIGQYNTCAHGCAYCYATFNSQAVAKNKREHDQASACLVGHHDETLADDGDSERGKQGDLF